MAETRTAESVIDDEAGSDYYQALYLTELDNAADAVVEAFAYFPATDHLRELCRQVLVELSGLGVRDCEVVALDNQQRPQEG